MKTLNSLDKPSTTLAILLLQTLSEKQVMNYSFTHRAWNKKHSITLEIKNSFSIDHAPAILSLYECAKKLDYSCYEEEPTVRNTIKFTFAFKRAQGMPPHGGDLPSWFPYPDFKPKKH